jgi:hypothetical protein
MVFIQMCIYIYRYTQYIYTLYMQCVCAHVQTQTQHGIMRKSSNIAASPRAAERRKKPERNSWG